MTKGQKRQVQQLMEDARWGAVEAFLGEFMEKNFLQDSVKRSSEFETIWYAAESEGGKRKLLQFFRDLETEAMNIEE